MDSFLFLLFDDILIVGHSKKDIADLKRKLSNQFDMKYLGDANHILAMRIIEIIRMFCYTSLRRNMCMRAFQYAEGEVIEYCIASLFETKQR